jgi:hypothetical protein
MNDEGQPVAYTALTKGTPVTSQSGRAFGTLDRVLDDGKGDILHGIAVTTERGPKFVARDSIERMTTAQIRCSLTDEQVHELPSAPSDRRVRTWPRFARRA